VIYERRRARVGSRPPCQCHSLGEATAIARDVANRFSRGQTHPQEVEPILIAASGKSRCRPFLRVEKDPVLFAACNQVADEIGPLEDAERAYLLIDQAIGVEVNEVFGLVTLDIHKRMKSIAETGRGEPSSVMAPIVPTLQAALIDGADSVIIFHVHPSGVEAEPSKADKDTTKAFAKAFEACGLLFCDHIIIGGDQDRRSYYSFAEQGQI
jgi:hypothetical protein